MLWAILCFISRDQSARERAVAQLGQAPGAWAEKLLSKALHDRAEFVRVAALRSLGKSHKPQAVALFVQALSDRSAWVRRVAAEWLETRGWRPTDDSEHALLCVALEEWKKAAAYGAAGIAPLVSALWSGYAEKRQAALQALESLGWQPTDDTQRALHAIAARQWREVVYLGAPAIEPLVAVLGDRSSSAASDGPIPQAPRVSEIAAELLLEINDTRAVELLIATLNDGRATAQVMAAQLLVKLAGPRARKPLLTILKYGESQVRRAAVESLEALGWRAVSKTHRALHAITHGMWQEAVNLGHAAVEPLIMALDDSDELVSQNAVWALGKIGDARAITPLSKYRLNKDRDYHLAVIEAYRNIGGKEVVPFLTSDLCSNDEAVVEAAVEALGVVGGAETVEPLISVLNRGNLCFHAQVKAIRELGKLGDARAVKPLFEIIKSDVYKVATESLELREAATEALESMDLSSLTPEDAEPVSAAFEKTLDHWDPELVRISIRILERVEDPRLYAWAVRIVLNDRYGATLDEAQRILRNQSTASLTKAIEVLNHVPRDSISPTARQLAEIWQVDFVEMLVAALRKESSPYRQKGIINALQQHDDPRVLELLIDTLAKDEDEQVREVAANALGEIGYLRAIGALEHALTDRHARVVRAARTALVKIRLKGR